MAPNMKKRTDEMMGAAAKGIEGANIGKVAGKAMDMSDAVKKANKQLSGVGGAVGTGLEGIEATVSKAMPNLDQQLQIAKVKVADAVKIVADTIGSVKTHLAEMAPIHAEAMVARVADGLAGKSAVKVDMAGTSIKVKIDVKLDSLDLANALAGEQNTFTKSTGDSYFEPKQPMDTASASE